MATSKRERAKRAAAGKPESKKLKVVLRPDESLYKGELPETPHGRPPIPQTSSWSLAPVSARLWFQNFNTVTILYLLPSLCVLLGSVIYGHPKTIDQRAIEGSLIISVSFIWLAVNVPASYYLQLRAVHGERPTAWQCYKQSFRYILRLIGLAALLALLIGGGLLMFIYPGLVMLRRYSLAYFYLLDNDIGIREAMARSAADSKPVAWSIWGIYGVEIVLFVATFVLFGELYRPYGPTIGALITGLYVFGPALRYKEVGLRRPAIETDAL